MSQVIRTSLEEILGGEKVHVQLSVPELVEQAIKNGEGKLTSTGAFSVYTGKFTGRSPKDKYIVDEPSVHEQISWGEINQPLSVDKFKKLYQDVIDHLKGKELYVFDGFAGADPDYRLPIRVVSELAWHNLFGHQLFIRPTEDKRKTHVPEWHVIYASGFNARPAVHGTRSETFIVVSFEEKVILIGGTQYAGEMKKSVFSVMNALLPQKGILSMHCSANVGKEGDVALFFGLSGTGKTTLSADPNRALIGDDEHGWSDTGVFNIEGGCYAKCIRLSPEKEPQIYQSIRFGAVLENVTINPETRIPDFDDDRITENTRAAYPIDHIPGAVIPGVYASHPRTILFLTADAFGVLPPISKLTPEQAMYHYLSGYTSKLAGTERGVTEPEATFSSCFGAPFLPLYVSTYAKMLGEKIRKHHTRVYLVNTGWSGGPYGVGKRINLAYTRAMVTAALNGELEKAAFTPHPIFGLLVPDHCPGVPSEILDPARTWADKGAYEAKAKELSKRFDENFARLQKADPFIAGLSKNW
ncbi:phosphoenolpyruvate carboxykinase (ATP) [Thermicanus aegyptius]|uniref:phosphoenolpyruvate carboxykinase (ATP) n=1 Tax=Thermicanus aegyptius TaxID=94009 RepID=UPI00048BA292|nr:phosphoenolpyruvate carboxykinase (ATP) [Thermicanus aegyptius]